jgi:diacylglycerol kinase family enzyme
MRALLVHNPDAGACRPSAKKLMALLKDAGLSPTYCGAKDEGLAKILADAEGIVFAAGGDGTVTRVATQLQDRDIPVVILPLGTANNIARSLGISGTVEEIIEGWRNMKAERLDICVATGVWGKRKFVEAVGMGALADATRVKVREEGSVAKRIEKGRDAFRKAVAQAAPVKVDVKIDGKRIKGDMLLAEIMNIGLVGSNLRLAPLAMPGDRKFDAVFVPLDHRDAFLTWLRNPEVEDAPVVIETGETASVSKGSAPLRIGDKISEEARGEVRVAIEEEQQTMLVPSARKDNGKKGGGGHAR